MALIRGQLVVRGDFGAYLYIYIYICIYIYV